MCVSLSGADRESWIIYMEMREEERRYIQGPLHRKCQALNKNKVAGRAAITNTLNSCQTNNSPRKQSGGETGGDQDED